MFVTLSAVCHSVVVIVISIIIVIVIVVVVVIIPPIHPNPPLTLTWAPSSSLGQDRHATTPLAWNSNEVATATWPATPSDVQCEEASRGVTTWLAVTGVKMARNVPQLREISEKF